MRTSVCKKPLPEFIARLKSSAFAWMILFVVILELVFAIQPIYEDRPHASEALRNSTPVRGWPEYVSEKLALENRDRQAVLIGTSQGIGFEFADPKKIFFSYLRQNLSNQVPGVSLENWSIAGIHIDQLELLTLQAMRRNVDLVVVFISAANIDPIATVRLGLGTADVDLLAGDPVLWSALAQTLIFQNSEFNDIWLRAFLLNSRLGRYRIALYDRLFEGTNRKWQRSYINRSWHPAARLNIAQRLQHKQPFRFNIAGSLRYTQVSSSYWERKYRQRRLPSFDIFYQHLRKRFMRSGTRLLWIWAPTAGAGNEKNLIKAAQPIYREICARIRSDGWDCFDLSQALPTDHFISSSISSHFNAKGHKAVAELITPPIVDALQ